ncbi:hypothetical protein E4U43_001991 [Claviceps pusilla]|uniref:Uncharacterized protein n=1 Tax=Claviceps pusilla TaxID=123648 RepID=A0A9P7N797_9HYPO|nr:hypothetical protein E4U43_001991 [Claviceps pusilla]
MEKMLVEDDTAPLDDELKETIEHHGRIFQNFQNRRYDQCKNSHTPCKDRVIAQKSSPECARCTTREPEDGGSNSGQEVDS